MNSEKSWSAKCPETLVRESGSVSSEARIQTRRVHSTQIRRQAWPALKEFGVLDMDTMKNFQMREKCTAFYVVPPLDNELVKRTKNLYQSSCHVTHVLVNRERRACVEVNQSILPPTRTMLVACRLLCLCFRVLPTSQTRARRSGQAANDGDRSTMPQDIAPMILIYS